MTSTMLQSSRAQTYTIDGRRFLLEQRLGQGSFGEVFKVKEESNGDVYALKVMKITDTSTSVSFEREINALRNSVKHENIVKLYAHSLESNKLEALILMEFCEGGNLNTRLDQPGITERLKIGWMRELSSAIRFLHSKGIVHRDLKPENILLTSSDSIKLADFGLAREFAALKHEGNRSDQQLVEYMTSYYMKSKQGTPFWMAPEVFNGHYTEKADIFSLGAIFYTIQTGKFITIRGKKYYGAFVTVRGQSLGIGKAMHNDPTITLPLEDISPLKRDLIEKMTKYNPRERPSASEVLDSIESML